MSPAACWNSAPIPICPRTTRISAKDKNVILYCGSGGRAALAGKMLKDLGYEQVYNLGGFKDWADLRRRGGEVIEPTLLGTRLRGDQRSAAAMLPPSTVVTSAVVLSASAWCTKACATSSAVTSRPSRLPLM